MERVNDRQTQARLRLANADRKFMLALNRLAAMRQREVNEHILTDRLHVVQTMGYDYAAQQPAPDCGHGSPHCIPRTKRVRNTVFCGCESEK